MLSYCWIQHKIVTIMKISCNNLKLNWTSNFQNKPWLFLLRIQNPPLIGILLQIKVWKCLKVLIWILCIYSSHYQCPDWGTLTFNNESWRAAQDNKALRAALVTLCRARLRGKLWFIQRRRRGMWRISQSCSSQTGTHIHTGGSGGPEACRGRTRRGSSGILISPPAVFANFRKPPSTSICKCSF